MKNLPKVFVPMIALLMVVVIACEDPDDKDGIEPGAPAITVTAPGLTFTDDVIHVSVSTDSVIVLSYSVTAPAKILRIIQVVDDDEEAIPDAGGLKEYSGQLTVNIPFADKTIVVKLQVTDESDQVSTKSFSIVVKGITLIVEEVPLDPASGGTAELSWNAPEGLADQKLIVLTSNTHTLTPPDKSVWLGFGEGWLYEQTDGTIFPSTISVGSEEWVIETPTHRYVHVDNEGYRWARSLLKPGGAANPAGAGAINWDSGSELGPGEFTFMYSVTRALAGINPGATFQWKQDRVRAARDLSGSDANSAYITENRPSGTGPRMQSYKGDQAKSCSTPTPVHQGLVHRFGWLWKQNTPDLTDGLARTFLLDDDHTSMVVHTPKNSSGDVQNDVVQSAFSERSRWALWQDYIGNNNESAGDIEILRSDMYIQRGGVLIFLADGTTPETTSIAVPLRYVSSDEVNNTITLKLWDQGEIDYASAGILLFDSDMNFLKGVSLIPD